MFDRRFFIRNSLVLGGGAAVITQAKAEPVKSTKVDGYEYRLPKFSQRSQSVDPLFFNTLKQVNPIVKRERLTHNK